MSEKEEKISCHTCGDTLVENGEVLKQYRVLKGISKHKGGALPVIENGDKHVCDDCHDQHFIGDIFYI